jgi:hypothetical protein
MKLFLSPSPFDETFPRRELVYANGDIFSRYNCYGDSEQFKVDVIKRQPDRIDIGPGNFDLYCW